STVIRTKAKQYLGTEEVGLLSSMKTAIADVVGESRDRPATDLTRDIGGLTSLVDQLSNAKNELELLHQAAERSNPDVMKAKEEIESLRSKLSDYQGDLDKFNGR